MSNKLSYIIQLDGLRFYAVLLVVIAHWVQGSIENSFFQELPFGHGVVLFFVISGYLITDILFKSNQSDSIQHKSDRFRILKNFYIRRVLRIFPLYYFIIFLLLIIGFKDTARLFPWLVSYTTNIYQSYSNEYIGSFNHFWSLAVEEQFYLFWPIIILFTKKAKYLKIIIGLILIAIFTRFILFNFYGKWMATSYFTLSCMHSIGLGALLAFIKEFNPNILHKIQKTRFIIFALAFYISLFMLTYFLKLQWYKEIFDEFTFAVFSFFVIAKIINGGFQGVLKKFFENKVIVYLGRISYGIYVIHLFVPSVYKYFIGIFNVSHVNPLLRFVFYSIICISIATISHLIIEKPFLKLKRYFQYSLKSQS